MPNNNLDILTQKYLDIRLSFTVYNLFQNPCSGKKLGPSELTYVSLLRFALNDSKMFSPNQSNFMLKSIDSSIILELTAVLKDLTMTPGFNEVIRLSFGSEISRESYLEAVASLPPIEVVTNTVLRGALGAYAANPPRIFIAESLLTGPLGSLKDVVLEEIGHFLDQRFNATDTPGDEGAVFAALVQGRQLSSEQLKVLQEEDDHAEITLSDVQLPVELMWGQGGDVDVGQWYQGGLPNLVVKTINGPSSVTEQYFSIIYVVDILNNHESFPYHFSDLITYSKDYIYGNHDDVELGNNIIAYDPTNRLFSMHLNDGTFYDEYMSYNSVLIGYTAHFDLKVQYLVDGYFFINADAYNNQMESNEVDNITILHIKSPDLIVDKIVAPSTVSIGRNFNLSWTIINIGSG
jgi:hypothetical protein